MEILDKLGEIQEYENIKMIPIIGNENKIEDLLDLKTGFEMGIVEVKECVPETVNTIIVINNAVTPLIIFDGEQIEGAKQNRIINQTIIIPPKTEMKVPVSCTEQGRWSYKSEFKHSSYFANSDTRRSKRQALDSGHDSQHKVWRAISDLEKRCDVKSNTSALLDTYNATKVKKDEYLNNFNLIDNQIGAIFSINNKFKGMEILNDSDIYKRYHDMILNSYIIDAISTKDEENDNEDNLQECLENVSNLEQEELKSIGIEKVYKESNGEIIGTVATYKDDLIHATYFRKEKEEPIRDVLY